MESTIYDMNFIPIFSVRHDVLLFCCGTYDEKTMLQFMRKFEPFSKVKFYSNTAGMISNSSNLVKESLINSLKFDDNDQIVDFYILNKIDPTIITTKTTTSEDFQKPIKYQDTNYDEIFENSSFNNSSNLRFYLDEESQNALISSSQTEIAKIQKKPSDSNLEIRLDLANVFSQQVGKDKLIRQMVVKGSTFWKDKVRQKINLNEKRSFTKVRKRDLDLGFCILRGTADGVDKKENQIIQVKLRRSNSLEINQKMSQMDKVEAHCFMKSYSANSCLRIDMDENENISQYEIKFDYSFWQNEIYNKLKEFTNKANRISINDFRLKWQKYF